MTFPHFEKNVLDNLIQSIKSLIDCTHQLQLRWNVLGFQNRLRTIKMIKDQIQCRSQSLMKFRCTEYGTFLGHTPTSWQKVDQERHSNAKMP